MNVSPEIVARFNAWAYAELGSHYADGCPDEVMTHLVDQTYAALDALAKTPADSADDLILKVFPLLLATYEPKMGNPPMLPAFGDSNNGCPVLLSIVNQEMMELVPALAAVMRAKNFRDWREAA